MMGHPYHNPLVEVNLYYLSVLELTIKFFFLFFFIKKIAYASSRHRYIYVRVYGRGSFLKSEVRRGQLIPVEPHSVCDYPD